MEHWPADLTASDRAFIKQTTAMEPGVSDEDREALVWPAYFEEIDGTRVLTQIRPGSAVAPFALRQPEA